MKGETEGAELLAIALTTLEARVSPELSGEARYSVLMLASALKMAIREAERKPALTSAEAEARTIASRDGPPVADDAALCRMLRAGHLRGDPALHRALWKAAALAASITRPQALAAAERQMAGLTEADR